MKKVLLLLDCDHCRCLYDFARFASEDTTAWDLHGRTIAKRAFQDGWARTPDDNFHYCPDCIQKLEAESQFYLVSD